jgi:Protein of unknown function (DUF2726)
VLNVGTLPCASSSWRAAIELDDKTHERPMRVVADQKKNAVLQDANVHLIRWRASALPGDEEIRHAFTR